MNILNQTGRGIFAAATGLRAQDYSQTVIKVTPLSGSVYMLEGAGGNIGLSVGSDDAFLIDDQFASLTPKIRAAIATVTDRPVRFLLNTHWHSDHAGGNENMAGAGAIIIAQENVRHRLSTEQFIEAFKLKVPASPRAALPVVTFSESITLYVNDDSVAAVHVPHAHTDGDVIVFFQKANVIHMGDTFFNGRYPLIDLSSGGSVHGMIAAADRALKMSNSGTRFIPGHGPMVCACVPRKHRRSAADIRRAALFSEVSPLRCAAAHRRTPRRRASTTWQPCRRSTRAIHPG